MHLQDKLIIQNKPKKKAVLNLIEKALKWIAQGMTSMTHHTKK